MRNGTWKRQRGKCIGVGPRAYEQGVYGQGHRDKGIGVRAYEQGYMAKGIGTRRKGIGHGHTSKGIGARAWAWGLYLKDSRQWY